MNESYRSLLMAALSHGALTKDEFERLQFALEQMERGSDVNRLAAALVAKQMVEKVQRHLQRLAATDTASKE